MMRPTRLCSAVLLFCAGLPALAANEPGTTTIGVNLGRESLSNGRDDWREDTVRVTRDIAARTLAELALTETRRFGLTDTQLAGVFVMPAGDKLVATFDANYSATHRVLARNAFGAALQYEFAPAWLVHAGARTTSYDLARVNQGMLMLERYVGAYSTSIAWRPTRAYGATAHGVALQGAWYYGDKDSVSLTLSSGREASSVPGGVVLSSVRAVALTGRHLLTPAWTLNYSLSHSRQAELYTRKGLSVGLAYSY